MSVKSIETSIFGVDFRSRLEARWAIFFDTIGIQWQYEPEKIQLRDKVAIPDFWLKSLSAWFEVKPTQGISRRATMWPDAKGVVEKTGWPYLMAEGEPGRCLLSLVANVGTGERMLGPALFCNCCWCSDGVETNIRIGVDVLGKPIFYGNKCQVATMIPKSLGKSLPPNYRNAIGKAMGYRFDR